MYSHSYNRFGIRYGGEVEIRILKFLYDNRGYLYYVERIAKEIHGDTDSVRSALNRLYDRGYVIKRISKQDKRYNLYALKNDAKVYQKVIRRINLRERPFKTTGYSDDYSESEVDEEDMIDKISNTASRLAPAKTVMQLAFPPSAPAIEVGYQFVSHLGTMRDVYNLARDGSDLEEVLYKTSEGAAKFVCQKVVDSATQPIRDTAIPEAVKASSKFLEEQQVFSKVTRELKLDNSYKDTFKEFYESSLEEGLKGVLDKVTEVK